jgi:raffinose/stachyose/melibiose transport system permease protein
MATQAVRLNAPPVRRQRRPVDPVLIGLWIALVVVAILWLVPFIFILFTSLKSTNEMYSFPAYTPPAQLRLENYAQAWERGDIGTYAVNSLIITLVKVPVGIFVSALAAFAFTRLRFPYQKALFMFVIMGTMIPVQVALGPLFSMALNTGLLNTYIGIILPYIAFGVPYQVFLLRGFFHNIPRELDEAARIDGCSNFGLFWRIILPLSTPVLAALFILDFVATWNEFPIALVILQSSEVWTIPLGLQGFQGQFSSAYQLLNAAVVMSILPVLIVYLLFQRYFVTGLTSGAVKG